jgi:hypothetical protein
LLALPGAVGLEQKARADGAAEVLASSNIQQIYVVPLTHSDLGFTAPPSVVAEVLGKNLDNVITYASTVPDFRWTVEQIWPLRPWLEKTTDPAKIAQFFNLVRAGKISVSASFAGQHTAVMGEEETARFLYPAKQLREQYGIQTESLLLDDVPGWSWSYPQAMAKAGVKYFLAGPNTWLGGAAAIPLNHLPFYWQGPDGSSVLTWIDYGGYADIWNYGFDPWAPVSDMEAKVAAELAKFDAAGYPYDSILVMGCLFDNFDSAAYAATTMLSRINYWNSTHASPKMIMATPEDFFRHMEATYGSSFPTYFGNSSGLWDSLNCITPASTTMVRWARDQAPAAEKLGAINWLLGLGSYDRLGFEEAYINMLCYDEHSGGGPGWPGMQTKAEVDQENAEHFGFAATAHDTAAALFAGSLQSLGLGIRTASCPALLIYNSLSWSRSDLVEAVVDPGLLAAGFDLRPRGSRKAVAYQQTGPDTIAFVAEEVPPLGYRVYDLQPTSRPRRFSSEVQARGNRLENRYYRVVVDPATGRITSLLDKRARRELVNSSSEFTFNSLIKAQNADDLFFGNYTPVTPTGPCYLSSSCGPVSGSLLITRPGHALAFTRIVLYDQLPRLDIINTLDRAAMAYVPLAEHSWYYNLTFPFNLDLAQLVTRVETTAGFLAPPSVGYLPGAITGPLISQHALDLREGNRYGVTVAHREGYLSTLGRVARYTYSPLEPTLIFRTVQKFDQGNTKDLGIVDIQAEPITVYDFGFSFTTTSQFNPVGVTRFGWDFTTPLQPQYLPGGQAMAPLGADAMSLLSVNAPNVIILTLKRAEFGDTSECVVRMREISGLPVAVTLQTPFSVASAQEADLVEEPIPGAILPTSPVRFTIEPYEVKTIRLKLGALPHGRPGGRPWGALAR